MKTIWLKLGRKIGYAFFPARCPFCDRVIEPSQNTCESCAETVLPFKLEDNVWEKGTGGLIFLYPYEERPKEAVKRLKFEGRKDLAVPLARLMWAQIQKSGLIFDVIVPVPMSRKKLRKRGYNQAQVLAQEISRLSGIPLTNCLGHREMDTEQHHLSQKERRYWAKRTYFVSDKASCSDKRVLLIDDVYTTGSTVNACEKCLKTAGASSVAAAVLCKTERKN
jgi:competence protein ComFC